MTTFNEQEWQRYQRHVQLGSLGAAGQTRLKDSRVLIVGVGGLGCPAAQYLGAAGVGHITLVDGDCVDRANLQRQILFADADVGELKAEVGAARLRANNPHIEVATVCEHLSPDNAQALIAAADLVLDCTDNFATRYLINDVSLLTGTPWLFASVVQLSGQIALFTPDSACFRCLFPEAPEGVADCNSAGVLGPMPGLLGMLQAVETVKFLAGLATSLENTLLLVEGLSMDFRRIALRKNTGCRCGTAITIDAASPDYQFACAADDASPFSLDADAFRAKMNEPQVVLIDVRGPEEHTCFNIGGSNVVFSDDFAAACGIPQDNAECTVLLYCQSGIRSEKAANALQAAGVEKVFSLRGGLGSWRP